MKIYTDWRAAAGNGPAAFALGSFDGVHGGHRRLLESVRAARPDLPLGAVTFEPHPRCFFRGFDSSFRLMDRDQKRRALAQAGVKRLVEIPFDADLASRPAQEFVENILLGALNAGHVGTGADFAFGRGREGGVDMLRGLLARHGAGLTVCPALGDAQGPFSSTRARRYLCEGDMDRARALLGRGWAVRGEVRHGDKRGRALGFPTANVDLGDYLEPARGAYICAVKLQDGAVWPAVANVGCRPTVDKAQASRIEAHLLDFAGDLYGQVVEIMLIRRLRDEIKFPGLDALTAQIRADVEVARDWFAHHGIPAFLPELSN